MKFKKMTSIKENDYISLLNIKKNPEEIYELSKVCIFLFIL
jgi:hypothetical protein